VGQDSREGSEVTRRAARCRAYDASMLPVRTMWCAVLLLVAIGVMAAIGRGAFRTNFGARMEPLRHDLLAAIGRPDPSPGLRAEGVARFDRAFAEHPVLTFAHVGTGGLFLVLALLQFLPAVRNRHLQFHRWSGRVLVALSIVAAVTGLYFGLAIPFAGWGERVVIALAGSWFLLCLGKAVSSIRRRDVARHREWMIRAFGFATGISAVRLAAVALDVFFTPAGAGMEEIFVASLATGWLSTVAAAEWWLARSRMPCARPAWAARTS